MPMPMEFMHASQDFERYLIAARDISGLTTRNQTYTMTQGVFQTFRRRLHPKDAIRFANVLPPVLSALFIADWDMDETPVPFADRAAMTQEAQALRKDHNLSPQTCIRDVADALRRTIDTAAFDRVLASLPQGAADFWKV